MIYSCFGNELMTTLAVGGILRGAIDAPSAQLRNLLAENSDRCLSHRQHQTTLHEHSHKKRQEKREREKAGGKNGEREREKR